MRYGKYIGIITSLLLLAALLLLFTDPWSSFRGNRQGFILGDPDAIDRITLWDMYDSTELVRVDGTWMISGTERANQVAVENILFAAGHLEVRSILAEKDVPEERNERIVHFCKGDRILLSYDFVLAGGQVILKEKGSERLLMVSVAGYPEKDPDRIFSSSTGHFREHLLIDLMPSEISLIGIELPGETPFRFTQDPVGDIRCYPAGSEDALPGEALDELSIRLLFSYFTDIRFEHMSGIPASDLLSGGDMAQELAVLRVESRGGERNTLTVFPYMKEQGEPHMFQALVLHNDTDEAMVVNYIYLDVLMRDLSHYLNPGEQGPDSFIP